MTYLDSSVLVELYLGGARSDQARSILDRPESKVSSWLLVVEVPVVLRRALPAPADRDALAACLERFDADLEDIGLIDSLTDVGLRVRSDPRFSKCRALDAIQACTALPMREWTGRAVRLATFDERLEELGAELRLV